MVIRWRGILTAAVLAVCLLGGGPLSAKEKAKKPSRPAPAAPGAEQAPAQPSQPAPAASETPAPTAPAQATEASWTTDPASQFVFYAVLEGLYADGVDNSAMDLIIPVKAGTKKPDFTANFIFTCPLCEPALEAMRVYRARPAFLGFKAPGPDTIGSGIDDHLREQLNSPAFAQRQEAIGSLVEKWVRQRLDLLRATDAEKGDYRAKFEAARKKGLEILKGFQEKKVFGDAYAEWKRCPVCDGAVAACGGARDRN